MADRLDVFMARANAAYYANHDPFADFTTAPEISQVFGELLGLWAAVCWRLIGMPRRVLLIEAGPGRGTLMVDAIRAVRQAMPDFEAALDLRFIESSERLRAIQAERFPHASWHDRLDDVPQAPFLVIANEFLDALPIRQFVRRAAGWVERYVGPEGSFEQPASDIDIPPQWSGDAATTVREVCPGAVAFVQRIAERCRTHPGVALLIDYGPDESLPGDSLQAIADRKPADPFKEPGSRDLTAHVDFAALAAVARDHGVTVHGPVPQGLFLARLGLFQRTEILSRSVPPLNAREMKVAARRLGEPDGMGRLFKVMALSSPGMPSLPGFE